MMIIDPHDVLELKGCLLDFTETKEWNLNMLLAALANIEFNFRYDMKKEADEELAGE